MAYPTALDSFTSPTGTDYLNSPSHSTQHSSINTAIVAVETKLGITVSNATDATSGHTLIADGTGSSEWKLTKSLLTTDTDGATVTFDLDASNIHTVTLEGNRTLALSNADTGQAFIIRLLQDGTGSRTVTWFSTIRWTDGVTPTLTTTAAKADVFGFICTGANTYDGFIVGQNL